MTPATLHPGAVPLTVDAAPDALKHDGGVRLIAMYKFVKGALGFLGSVALMVLLATGGSRSLAHLAVGFEQHLAGAWSVSLAKVLNSATEPHHLRLAAIALGLDGVVTLIEGWALYHGHWWGPWLVVGTTSSLLPFEVVAMVRHLHVGRVIVFILNVAIVAYLAQRALKHRSRIRRPRSAA